MKSNVLKKIIYNVKLILDNLNNYKYLKIKKSCGNNGIVLLVHESRRLGASILALNIAKELVSQGENVYIITKRFGELNSEFAKIAPIQVIWNTTKLKKTLNYLHNKHNFNKAIANTALMGSYAKIANEEGYKVISLIHELGPVIQQLHAEQETKYLLKYSSKVIFSTQPSPPAASPESSSLPSSSDSPPQAANTSNTALNIINSQYFLFINFVLPSIFFTFLPIM